MQAQDFAEFVARQQGASDDVEANWPEIRDEWLKELDSLYSRIIDFLKEFVANGSIDYRFAEITLTEENIGTYQARRMNVSIGRQHVFLEPIGTLLVACRGRVDAVGSSGRAQLMLVNEKAKSVADLITVTVAKGGSLPSARPAKESISWAWKILAREPRGTFLELDRDSFFDLLVEIAGA